MERKRPSSKSSKKEDSSEKKVKKISRSIKKAFKRIHCEETSEEEWENAGSSRIQHSSHSFETHENRSRKKAPKKSEFEMKLPSTKSSEKHHSSKKYIEETSRLTRKCKGKSFSTFYSSEDDNVIENDDIFNKKLDPSLADKFIKTAPSSSLTSSSPDLTETRSSSPFRFWGKDILKPIVRKTHSEGEHNDSEKVKDGERAQNIQKSESNVTRQKDWEKFKAMVAQRKLDDEKKRSRSKIDKDPKEDGTKVEKDDCAQNVSKKVNKDNLKEVDDKLNAKDFLKKRLESWKELNRPKFDEAEKANNKLPTDEGSNENIAHLKFSPATAENKGVPKRRSDPSNALKENRPRTSI